MTIHRHPARIPAFAAAGLSSLLFLGFITACKSSSNSSAPIVNGPQDASADSAAADGNLAPVSGRPTTAVLGQSSSYTPQQSTETYDQQAPAPIVQNYNAPADDAEQAGEDALAASDIQADQPPPPLPDYEQPPAPEDDYLWTPGYWAYGPGGYYWTPGVWCPPPYYGALWTPPYWGYYGGRYRFHRGYWGPHIGFYGGVDYGFGYIGIGFFGGYWRGHDFYYNRSVTNVGHVTNVYNHTVIYNNVHYGPNIVNRVSYNGGRGGLNVAPRPQELAALRETHTPALREQVQVRTLAASNKAQFFAQNRGRPAQTALVRPASVSHQIAATPHAVQQEQQRSAAVQQRNTEAQHGPEPAVRGPEPAQRGPGPQQQQHAAPATEGRPAPFERAQPQQQAQPRTQPQARPQPQAQSSFQRTAPVQQRPAPVEQHTVPAPEERPRARRARRAPAAGATASPATGPS